MSSICVLGNFVADNCFYSDKLPLRGQTLFGTDHQVGPGGKGSNQAVAASRLGSKTFFIGKIGDDENGKMALNLFKKNKIETTTVVVSKKYPTGVAGILVNTSDGTNAIVVCPGASMEITKKEVDSFSKYIEKSNIFLTQLEVKTDVILHALKIAKKSNCVTILNPAPAIHIDDIFFKHIDFFTPNETEAEFYFKKKINSYEDAKQANEFFLGKGVKNSIITLGDKGIYFSNKDENFPIPALNIKNKVVDTTGAGDSFNGALAAALNKNMFSKDALHFAVKASGKSTMKRGAADSMPFLSDLSQ